MQCPTGWREPVQCCVADFPRRQSRGTAPTDREVSARALASRRRERARRRVLGGGPVESSELRDLLEFLAKSHFVEFEMEREGFRLRVLKAPVQPPPAASNGSPAAGALGLPAAAVPANPVPAAT